jgi:hypothetical protein
MAAILDVIAQYSPAIAGIGISVAGWVIAKHTQRHAHDPE